MIGLEILDINADEEKIKSVFRDFGNHAEHNFYHYKNLQAMQGAAVFAVSEKKYGIMGFQNGDTYWCYSDPLAPAEKKLEVLLEFVSLCFRHGAAKFRSEITEDLWKDVLKKLEGSDFRAIKPSYVYEWPVYDMKLWSPMLSGIKMKKIRNMRNGFMKDHKLEVMEKDQVSKKDIATLLNGWKSDRTGSDRAHIEHYQSAVASDFMGYDFIHVFVVDGKISALTGGWNIPNSNNFYDQLGITDYSVQGIGDITTVEDMNFLKSKGFDFVDLGGSTPEMMNFKKKFCPSYIYRTVEFSIVKN